VERLATSRNSDMVSEKSEFFHGATDVQSSPVHDRANGTSVPPILEEGIFTIRCGAFGNASWCEAVGEISTAIAAR
jgi:hypothetical protein